MQSHTHLIHIPDNHFDIISTDSTKDRDRIVKIKKKNLLKCFMRNAMNLKCLLDIKDTQQALVSNTESQHNLCGNSPRAACLIS